MSDELLQLAEEIEAGAKDRGLIPVRFTPRLQGNEEIKVIWEDSWQEFVDLAAQAEVKLAYIGLMKFSLKDNIDIALDIKEDEHPQVSKVAPGLTRTCRIW